MNFRFNFQDTDVQDTISLVEDSETNVVEKKLHVKKALMIKDLSLEQKLEIENILMFNENDSDEEILQMIIDLEVGEVLASNFVRIHRAAYLNYHYVPYSIFFSKKVVDAQRALNYRIKKDKKKRGRF